jgi:hypothetical protein
MDPVHWTGIRATSIAFRGDIGCAFRVFYAAKHDGLVALTWQAVVVRTNLAPGALAETSASAREMHSGKA